MNGQSEGYPTNEVLEPLTEQYNEVRHSRIYNLLSKILCDALELDKSSTKSSAFSKVRNIALSGGYGTGKSSVLCAFKNDSKFQDDKGNSNCLFISLSSLNGQGDDSSDNGRSGSDQTDLIEKEIVKQLLYQESSTISHFRRLRNIKPKRRWLYSSIFGVLMFLLCTGLGWTGKIRSFFAPNPQFWTSVIVALVLVVSFILACFISIPSTVQGRMRLKSLAAGSASLSLDEDDGETYFDKYLDEIAYFFSSSKKRVVIFEDIDRFDNTRIFEDLKELNTILNQDPSNEGRSICFVYAVRDSIFDTLGENHESESMNSVKSSYLRSENVERANRTKFFDLIIPMVPFMSPTAAKGWISSEFKNDGIDRRLIRLLSKHITDMRLIKNIHNEFLIFRSELMLGQDPSWQSALDMNRVLAMVAYKSVYPRDFEKLRLGKSSLDDIYRFKLQIVEKVRNEALHRSRVLKERLADCNRATKRTRKLGEILRTVLRLEGYGVIYYNGPVPLTVGKYTYKNEEQLDSIDFWRNVADSYRADKGLEFILSGGRRVKFSDLYELLATVIDDQNWMDNLDVAEQAEIDQVNLMLKRTAHANIQTVMNESDWESLPSSGELKTTCNLSKFVQSRYGHSLGRDLIAEGYISDDYQLYAASRNGKWLSNDGVNFEIHNLAQGEHSLDWKLTVGDCEAIYTDFGPEITKSKDAYNVQFLDWLLNRHPKQAWNMLRSPSDYDEWDCEFYAAYLADEDVSAENRGIIIGFMAEKSDKIFDFLVGSQELSDKQRDQYISVALSHLSKTMANGGSLDEEAREYLRKSDSNLECMQSTLLSKTQANLIANYYDDLEISLNDVSPLCPSMLEAIKKQHNYKINKMNFRTIFGSTCDFSLNEIRKRDKEEYELILDNYLSDYLIKINPTVTIKGDESEYSEIVSEVIETFNVRDNDDAANNNLVAVIQKSKPNQRVADLTHIFSGSEEDEASAAAQLAIRTMTEYKLFVPTPRNIFVYLNVMNEGFQEPQKVNSAFDILMERMPPSKKDLEENDLNDGELVELATNILNSTTPHCDLNEKIKLVRGLNLPRERLVADDLNDRKSSMFAKLMKFRLLPSTAHNFNLIQSSAARKACVQQWETLEEEAKIPSREIPSILGDSDVSSIVKEQIYSRLPDYFADSEEKELEATVNEAAKHDAILSFEVLNWIVDHLYCKAGRKNDSSKQTSDKVLTSFIHLFAKTIRNDGNLVNPTARATINQEITSILIALPGQYRELSRKGGKTVNLPLNDDNDFIAKAVKARLNTIRRIIHLKDSGKLRCLMR